MAFTGRSGYSSGSSSTASSGGTRVRSVTLTRRPPPAKLGFSIRGGKEHGTGFFVTAVETNSEAFKQGLVVGDQILRVNGFPVEDATHKEVLQLIQGQPTVTLKVKSVGMIPVKENPEDELSWQIVDPRNTSPNQLEVYKPDLCDDNTGLAQMNEVKMVLKVPPRAKLGCGICKGPEWKPGVFVQFTKENSIARIAGLRPGDQIIQCNNFTFTPETQFSEAVSVMKCSGLLELLVRKGAGLELFPGESSGYNSSASSVAGDNPPRLSVLHEESSHNEFSSECSNENGVEQNGIRQNRPEYTNGCTVIHVGGDETDNNKKIAEICMVSQQLETKTTTVFVEVHHSEEDSVSHTPSDASTDRLTNSSSVSSFTSSASSLSSAISQELERRSKRPPTEIAPKTNHQTDKLIKSGLAKEKVQQHEQLMQEFRKAHKRMFANETENVKANGFEERDAPRLGPEPKNKINEVEVEKERQLEERIVEPERSKRQVAPPPPPPLPSVKEKAPAKANPSIKKYPAPTPPSPPYCPTPDYDNMSIASENIEDNNNKVLKKPNQKNDIVEMQSLESFKLTNPSTVKPKPPNTYFTQNASLTSDTSNGTASTIPVKDKPIVTIREYPAGKERKNPTKFDFLQNISPPPANESEPIGSRLQSELTHTLQRATSLAKNETQVTNCIQNGQAKKGTIVTINVTPQTKNEPPKPFYLFPNGNQTNGMDNKQISNMIQNASKQIQANGKIKSNIVENGTKNSVTFNFSSKAQEIRNVNSSQPNGILKNCNANGAQVPIQTHLNEKIPQQKSIKFGGT